MTELLTVASITTLVLCTVIPLGAILVDIVERSRR